MMQNLASDIVNQINDDYFRKKVPSQMFENVLNISLKYMSMFKVNNNHIIITSETCSKIAIKTAKQFTNVALLFFINFQ